MSPSRRSLLATAAVAPLAAPAALAIPRRAAPPWTHESYAAAMKASGREPGLARAEFDAVQERKGRVLKWIGKYLEQRLGSADPAVLRAFTEVPREYYHYHYGNRASFATIAYEETAKPYPIGYGSALSDYLGQAYMTQLCRPRPGESALAIGTGSGFQISILSRIVERARSIEIVEPLGALVAKLFKPLGYENVETRVGDGYFGWPGEKDGFDIVIVTCAAQYVPPPLMKQLKPGGRLIIPIGQPFKREQILYVFTKDAAGKIHSRKDVGVYFIPMTGKMMADARPEAPPAAPKE
ncbi:MAG: protein-L-isoaspartate O-methyltransferase [Rhodospirillales bacterium]|nr:MAG: protein-L-isoaspartate O-methyltransferase [Rhodospirillales bacterium]